MKLGLLLAVLVTASCFQAPHDNGVVVTAADDCVTCHQAEYEAAGLRSLGSTGCLQATPPLHVGHMPTTCASCHQTTGWCPALEGIHPETQFPIQRGAHSEVECLDCHLPSLGASTDGMNVSCIGCHEHTQARMDAKHNEERDYAWDASRPAFCRDCHPSGRGD